MGHNRVMHNRSPLPLVFLVTALGAIASLGVARDPDLGLDGITRPTIDIELAFVIPGRLAELPVRVGDAVDAGAPLAVLDRREAELNVELLEARLANTAATDAARATLDLARNELARVRGLVEGGAGNALELERQQLEVTRAEAQLNLQSLRTRETEIQLEAARESLSQYTLLATKAGSIEEVRFEVGETVDALQGVVRLVNTSTLRVEVAVPIEDSLTLKPGDDAWALLLTADRGAQWMAGVVESLAAVADAGSQSRLVRISVPNPVGLPAGGRTKVRFTPAQ